MLWFFGFQKNERFTAIEPASLVQPKGRWTARSSFAFGGHSHNDLPTPMIGWNIPPCKACYAAMCFQLVNMKVVGLGNHRPFKTKEGCSYHSTIRRLRRFRREYSSGSQNPQLKLCLSKKVDEFFRPFCESLVALFGNRDGSHHTSPTNRKRCCFSVKTSKKIGDSWRFGLKVYELLQFGDRFGATPLPSDSMSQMKVFLGFPD